jgi:hypothetical protein
MSSLNGSSAGFLRMENQMISKMYAISVKTVGASMIRKLVIVAIGLLAIVSWMALFMSTVKFLLGE